VQENYGNSWGIGDLLSVKYVGGYNIANNVIVICNFIQVSFLCLCVRRILYVLCIPSVLSVVCCFAAKGTLNEETVQLFVQQIGMMH
jgi:hypothetical protein